MWRATGASVIGTSHIACDKPCQDYSGYTNAVIGGSSALIIVIADGAGSARHSDVGSRATVEYLLQAIPKRLLHLIDANDDFATQVLTETIGHLNIVATDYECGVEDLACTVLVAVLSESVAFFARVGDGAWVIQQDGKYAVPIWPSNGEYINETTFLTSVNWQASLGCHLGFGEITAVAGFTDGIERVALEFSSRSAFAPFFDPLFKALQNGKTEEELKSGITEFLLSERFSSRTDDDKTLILACRQQPLFLQF